MRQCQFEIVFYSGYDILVMLRTLEFRNTIRFDSENIHEKTQEQRCFFLQYNFNFNLKTILICLFFCIFFSVLFSLMCFVFKPVKDKLSSFADRDIHFIYCSIVLKIQINKIIL